MQSAAQRRLGDAWAFTPGEPPPTRLRDVSPMLHRLTPVANQRIAGFARWKAGRVFLKCSFRTEAYLGAIAVADNGKPTTDN